MTTLTVLRNRVLRLLSDPNGDTYDDALLLDSINSAFDAILPWVPKASKSTITGTGATSYALPTDLYELQSVEDTSSGLIIPQAVLAPGQYRDDGLAAGDNDWILYPNGYITFSKALGTDDIFTVFYHAFWPRLDSNTISTNELETPSFVETGLALYASAYALLPDAIGIASLRNWNTRQDSGQPEHNPIQKTTIYLLDLFIKEMNRQPKILRATK